MNQIMTRMMMIWSYFLQPPTWVTWSQSPAANLKSSSQGAGPPYYVAADDLADEDHDHDDHRDGCDTADDDEGNFLFSHVFVHRPTLTFDGKVTRCSALSFSDK